MSLNAARILIFIIGFPASVWISFVGTNLWKWFAVPLGAPAISLVYGMGFYWLISFYRVLSTPIQDRELPDMFCKDGNKFVREYLARITVFPTVSLLMGWILTLFLK